MGRRYFCASSRAGADKMASLCTISSPSCVLLLAALFFGPSREIDCVRGGLSVAELRRTLTPPWKKPSVESHYRDLEGRSREGWILRFYQKDFSLWTSVRITHMVVTHVCCNLLAT